MAKTKADIMAMIQNQPVADMITIDEDNKPTERPMWTSQVDDDLTVYFGADVHSDKCQHLLQNDAILLVWPIDGGYVSMRGQALISKAPEMIDHVWNESFLDYFPGGKTDSNLAIIMVTPLILTHWSPGTMDAETIEV